MIPLHYLCLSSGVCLHYRRFSSCCLSFPTPVSFRDWRDFPQTQPCLDLESETAPCSSVYSAVSQSDGIKNESFWPKQGIKSVWRVPQVPCVPLMQISLSVRLWVPVLPADGWYTCLQVPSSLSLATYRPVSPSCFNSLTIRSLW